MDPMTLGARKADRVADDLLRRIVSGQLEVGSLLPKEAELAEEFGFNRSVIREAIKLLEVHRLVRPIRRRGTEVLDPIASVSPEVLQAMIVPAPGRIERDRLRDFLEIRATLDVQLSVFAAERRTEVDLQRLDAHVEQLTLRLGERQRYREESDAFSRSMARATQNRMFEMLVWWNQQVASELADVFNTARPANEPHLVGVRTLVRLVRDRDVAGIRELVTAFHAWASPRIVAAAGLATGASLESLLAEGDR